MLPKTKTTSPYTWAYALQGFEEQPVEPPDHVVFKHLRDFSKTQSPSVTWGKSPEG